MKDTVITCVYVNHCTSIWDAISESSSSEVKLLSNACMYVCMCVCKLIFCHYLVYTERYAMMLFFKKVLSTVCVCVCVVSLSLSLSVCVCVCVCVCEN